MNMHVRIQNNEIDYSSDDWMESFINQKIENERKHKEDRQREKSKRNRREDFLDRDYSR
jgi:hypothetical protein